MAAKMPVLHGRTTRQVNARARHRKINQTSQFNAKATNCLLGINAMQTSPGKIVARAHSHRHTLGSARAVRITDTNGYTEPASNVRAPKAMNIQVLTCAPVGMVSLR
jgi:hypothetical protein